MKTKIVGLDKLRRKLAALPQAEKNRIREAIAKSAREIADLAESLVPQDSGLLAGSIGWTWGDAPKGSMALATARSGDIVATVYAGDSDAFYSRFVEFGTPTVRAQPYFFPAYRALRKRAKSRIKRAHITALKKVAAS